MTLTELRYIIAVAKTKHFGRAADECFVSQPTLSVGIRKLEDSLGVTIFERGRSEVKITPIGETIIKQAQNALAETDVINDIAAASKNQLKEPVRIASTYTIGKYLFPHLVKQIYITSPELSVLLNQDYHEKLLSKLANKDLDILLLSVDANSNDYNNTMYNQELCFQPLLQEDLYVLAANSNKYSSSNTVSPNDMSVEDLLLMGRQHCLYNQVLSINPNWYNTRSNLKETNLDSLESLQDLVESTSGVTIVPALFGLELQSTNNGHSKLVPFTEPSPKRVLSLVWRKDFPRMQAIDTFKQCLQKISVPGLQAV